MIEIRKMGLIEKIEAYVILNWDLMKGTRYENDKDVYIEKRVAEICIGLFGLTNEETTLVMHSAVNHIEGLDIMSLGELAALYADVKELNRGDVYDTILLREILTELRSRGI